MLAVIISLAMAVAHVPQPSFLESFLKRSSEECMDISYVFESEVSDMKLTGEGIVRVQGTCYHMKANGIDVYCDGISTWLVDEPAREVMIESAESMDSGYLANPLILLMNLDKLTTSHRVEGDMIVMTLPNGTALKITITEMKTSSTKKPEAFRPPAEFDSGWIVTDLR